MTLSDAIESKRGKSYQEIYLELSSETVSNIGAIRADNLRDVVSILASGLQFRLESAEPSAIRTALLTGFKYMALPDYAFNLAQPDVMMLLLGGVDAGLINEEEKDKFIALATYETAKYPELTFKDIVEHFEPDLVNVGEWSELVYSGGKLALTLAQSLPEPSLIRIEASESLDGKNWTAFKRINHFYDVFEAGLYLTDIPRSNLQRKIRWCGEHYKTVGLMVGV